MFQQQETISEKADRLKENYRVIVTGYRQALVIGDHDTYHVKRDTSWQCDCLWGRYRGRWKRCSHIVAVQRAMKDPSSQAPVARLADLLQNAGDSRL